MATTFSLENKALKLSSRADIEPHLEALIANDDVEEFILQGNTIGIEASQALAEVLKTKSKLKTANLADIYTSRTIDEIPQSLDALLPSLLPHPHLTTINLSDNAFGKRMEPQLVAFLSSHLPLQHLILNNNGLGPLCGTAIANALTALASKKTSAHPKLETVVCGRNRLESGSMEAWSRAFAAHTGVKVVRMVQNGIRPEGISQLLTEGLVHCTDLEILDLQDNTFTLKGAKALAAAVGAWTVIKELGVGEVLLGAKGTGLLADKLAKGKNKEMRVLRLQFNDINRKALKGLKGAVKVLDKLELLELNGNCFSEEDDLVNEIRDIFEDRGLGELDELDEMEEPSDEEEEEEEEEEKEKEDARERIVKDAEAAEAENVPQEKDKNVDDLADILGKTKISDPRPSA
ncbi:uncharacterized protein DFL_007088 [Arthrobotrys flagrans]|uniref:Ran GTPase-activating protein 1 n=1 Tax=Arthrobotrys flagrans TaxID=97331 RepID=A0A436ZUS5_ARTFL|nr:hypothetical protein DFL_007088 [Arthrobotrys flagrans]